MCPQTSVKVVGGQVTSVNHMLTMAFDDPSMDDLRAADSRATRNYKPTPRN